MAAGASYEDMTNKNRFDDDAIKLIKATANKEDLNPFQQEIQSMSSLERLQFANALNRQAREFNYQSLMDNAGPNSTKKSPIVDIEAPRDKKTGELVDLDILVLDNAARGTAKMGAEQTASRVDLFDPKDGSGKEIDGLQQANKDAGAYIQMEGIIRSDELIYGGDKGRQVAESGKSSKYIEIYNRMSEQISDPDRRARAQEVFNTPYSTTITDKYDLVARSSFPEYSVMQLPDDLRSTLEKPYDRVINSRYGDHGYALDRYKNDAPEYRSEFRIDGGSYYQRGRRDYNNGYGSDYRSDYNNRPRNGYGNGYRNDFTARETDKQ